jgi:hypothetical protein
VAERVRAVEVIEGEAAHELLRTAGFLVDLDRLARAHHAELRMSLPHPRLCLVRLGVDHEDRMAGARLKGWGAAEGLAELGREGVPVLERVGRKERQLARAARSGVAVDGDARAIRPAIRHLLQHRAQVPTERLLDLRRLREQPDNSTHMSSTYIAPDR